MNILMLVVLAVVLIALVPLAIMLLWNWLIVSILGLVAINYLEALGLFVLVRIFISGANNSTKKD